ncbi:MAG: hypothetical protein EBS05_11550 [Proteobacteria bacterium]|nr:hypothetical protein [Pseudomonadota bacterium]
MGFPALPNTFARPGEDASWTLSPAGTGSADFHARTVAAPYDLSDSSRYRRALANATVAAGHADLAGFSADSGIPLDIVQATDAARVQGLLGSIQETATHGVWDDDVSTFDTSDCTPTSRATDITPPQQLPTGILSYYEINDDIISAYNTIARYAVNSNVQDARDYFDWHYNPPSHGEDNYRKRMNFREKLHATFLELTRHTDSSEPNDSFIDSVKDPSLTEDLSHRIWELLQDHLNFDDGDPTAGESFIEAPPDPDYDVPWCEMIVVKPELHMPLKSKFRRNSWRISDEGSFIKRPDRFCSDGRVFGSRRRKPPAGAVLIDCSGSMSLTSEDIDTIMEHAPGITVATYCSTPTTGYLHIVARKGKRADDDHLQATCGCNGCDGPALRWLAAQSGPLTWICDGIVTGINDEPHPDLSAECEDIVRKHHIKQYTSMHSFMAAHAPRET